MLDQIVRHYMYIWINWNMIHRKHRRELAA